MISMPSAPIDPITDETRRCADCQKPTIFWRFAPIGTTLDLLTWAVGIDLHFQCVCGSLTGRLHDIDPSVGDHLICHCSDCLAFARYLDCAERVPNDQEGIELFQTRVSRMSITSGKENLSCVHLTEKRMLRWFTRCCRTPLFHTLETGWVPFVTTHVAILNPENRAAAIGEPRGHTHIRNPPAGVDKFREVSMFSVMAFFFVRMCKDLLSGAFRRAELFEPTTLKPVVQPIRLSQKERMALGR